MCEARYVDMRSLISSPRVNFRYFMSRGVSCEETKRSFIISKGQFNASLISCAVFDKASN